MNLIYFWLSHLLIFTATSCSQEVEPGFATEQQFLIGNRALEVPILNTSVHIYAYDLSCPAQFCEELNAVLETKKERLS